jgi:UDP-N-acetylmuramyl tripeptide synthase
MTTITLKINERTKKGKAFLEMARAFFEDSKEIEIIKVPNAATQKAIDESKKGKGLNSSTSHKDLMEKLLS